MLYPLQGAHFLRCSFSVPTGAVPSATLSDCFSSPATPFYLLSALPKTLLSFSKRFSGILMESSQHVERQDPHPTKTKTKLWNCKTLAPEAEKSSLMQGHNLET